MSQKTAAYESIRRPPIPPLASVGVTSSVLGVVAEVRRQPSLGLRDGPSLARGVVGDLVWSQASDHEVLGLRMAEVDARDRRAGPHRHRLGQLHAGAGGDVEQL